MSYRPPATTTFGPLIPKVTEPTLHEYALILRASNYAGLPGMEHDFLKTIVALVASRCHTDDDTVWGMPYSEWERMLKATYTPILEWCRARQFTPPPMPPMPKGIM